MSGEAKAAVGRRLASTKYTAWTSQSPCPSREEEEEKREGKKKKKNQEIRNRNCYSYTNIDGHIRQRSCYCLLKDRVEREKESVRLVKEP